MTEAKTEKATLLEDFLREFPVVWKSIPFKGLFVSMLVVWVCLFEFLGNSTFGYINSHSLFAWTFYSYLSSIDDEHGFYIPLIVLALLWYKREDFRSATYRPSWAAFSILAVALVIHVLGYLVQQTRVSIAAFYLGIYGITGVVWGAQALKRSFFPMCLFVFAVPLGTLAESLTFPLRLLATKVTGFFASNILGINVVQRGTQLFDPNGAFQYEVAAACSGLRSLTAVLALCTIYAFLNFSKLPRRVLMIAAAFPLALAGNVCRLLLIITVSEAFGQKHGQWVHDSSWFSILPYIPPIIGIAIIGHFLREQKKPAPVATPSPVHQPA